jgi:hypothetical protein
VWVHGLLGRYSTNMCPRSIGSARSTLFSSCVFDMGEGGCCWLLAAGGLTASAPKAKATKQRKGQTRQRKRQITAEQRGRKGRPHAQGGSRGKGERESPSLSLPVRALPLRCVVSRPLRLPQDKSSRFVRMRGRRRQTAQEFIGTAWTTCEHASQAGSAATYRQHLVAHAIAFPSRSSNSSVHCSGMIVMLGARLAHFARLLMHASRQISRPFSSPFLRILNRLLRRPCSAAIPPQRKRRDLRDFSLPLGAETGGRQPCCSPNAID